MTKPWPAKMWVSPNATWSPWSWHVRSTRNEEVIAVELELRPLVGVQRVLDRQRM